MSTANAIFLIGLMFIGITMTSAGYIFRRPALAFGSGIVWLVFAGHSYTMSLAIWDIFYDMMILGVVMFLVVLMEGLVLRPRQDQQDSSEDYYGREMEDYATKRQNSRLWRDYMRTIAEGDAKGRQELRERRDKMLVLRAKNRRVKPNGDIEYLED